MNKIKTITLCFIFLFGNALVKANWVVAPDDSQREGSSYIWVVNETEDDFDVSTDAEAPAYVFGENFSKGISEGVCGMEAKGEPQFVKMYSGSGHYKMGYAGAIISFVTGKIAINFEMSKKGGSQELTSNGFKIMARWYKDDKSYQGWKFIIEKSEKLNDAEACQNFYPDLF